MSMPPLMIITGPTGAGKSALALELALALKGEIINADSLALYRGFDIGTAKPKASERDLVPHHLIDVLDPDQNFDAAAYFKAARPIVTTLCHQKRTALVVGGTGLYLRSLIHGLFEGPGRDVGFRAELASEAASGVDLHARLTLVDPETAARLAPADRVRVERALEVYHLSGRSISQWQKEHAFSEKPFRVLTVVIDREPQEMEQRMEERSRYMFRDGLVAEVENLLAAGWSGDLKPFGAIGYKQTLEYLRGQLTQEEALEKTIIATRRYAKRQRTWFRGQMPQASWFHPQQSEDIKELALSFFKGILPSE